MKDFKDELDETFI